MGSRRDARTAGTIPKKMPTPAEKPSPIANDHHGSEIGKPVASVTAKPMPLPQRMPSTPPMEVRKAASDRNWNNTSCRRAPSAFRTPISRVRSVTEIIMIAITPIPPDRKRPPRQRDREAGSQRNGQADAAAAEDAKHAADGGEEGRLRQELEQHLLPPRAERLPDADFPRPLGHRDHHDRHHADAARSQTTTTAARSGSR